MEDSDQRTADSVWFGYECKSGEILFYYNRKTGKYRAKDLCCSESNVIKVSINDLSRKHPSDVHSVGTQTEDYRCTNGCSSIYIHNGDESMCFFDRTSNICHLSVDGHRSETSETVIPKREDEDNEIDEEYDGVSGKLGNNKDFILNDICRSTGLLPDEPSESERNCIEECDREVKDSNCDSTVSVSFQTTEDVPDLIKDDKSIGSKNVLGLTIETFPIRQEDTPFRSDILNETLQPDKAFGLKDKYYNDKKSRDMGTKERTMSVRRRKVNTQATEVKGQRRKKKLNQKHYAVRETRDKNKPFGCLHCDKEFEGKNTFNQHLKIHSGVKPFQCPHCTKPFSQKSYLSYHIGTHNVEKPFKCSRCDKAFIRKGELNCHIKTHTGEKPFKCLHCGKAFLQKSHMGYHIRTHTGEKPFKCSSCDKAFIRKGELNRHIKTHTGEKAFQCLYCDKAFIKKWDCDLHIRTHTGEKPYKCLHCHKAFTQNVHLKHHVRTHMGEKPFKCLHCDKAFARKWSLKYHIGRTHTKE